MSGYYDYTPLVVLSRPVALTSLLTEETRKVGLQLAALSGLGYRDLDRAVEHQVGMSLWRLTAEQGADAYRTLEVQILPRLLDDRPPGVLVLGDGTLLDPRNRDLLLERATLVVLELDLASCYWRLRQAPTHPSGRWHLLSSSALGEISELRPFYEARRAGFACAHHAVELEGRRRGQVVEEVWGLVSRGGASAR